MLLCFYLQKKILYWYKPWGSDVNTRRLPRDCGGCEITGDVAQVKEEDYDVATLTDNKLLMLPSVESGRKNRQQWFTV